MAYDVSHDPPPAYSASIPPQHRLVPCTSLPVGNMVNSDLLDTTRYSSPTTGADRQVSSRGANYPTSISEIATPPILSTQILPICRRSRLNARDRRTRREELAVIDRLLGNASDETRSISPGLLNTTDPLNSFTSHYGTSLLDRREAGTGARSHHTTVTRIDLSTTNATRASTFGTGAASYDNRDNRIPNAYTNSS